MQPITLYYKTAPAGPKTHLGYDDSTLASRSVTDHFSVSANTGQLVETPDHLLVYEGHPTLCNGGGQIPLNSGAALEALVRKYRSQGPDFVSDIGGHFALVFADLKQNMVIAASDRMGVYRLYWHQTADGGLVISSSLNQVKSALRQTPDISPDALYAYMYFHMVPTPLSIYQGIEKLAPATCLHFQNNQVALTPYWLPSFRESNKLNIDELSSQLHQLLQDSLRHSTGDGSSYAAFLSGGLDSSTVVGVMSNVCDSKESYSIGFDAKEYDETPYARITAKHFQSNHHEYYVTPGDVLNSVPLIAATYDEPFGNSSAMPVYYCAKRAAENGVQLMLAGDGGDEIFGGNARYATQRWYRYYQNLPKPLRNSLLKPLINALPSGIPLATKAQNYIRQAEIPLPDRLQIYNFLHRHDPLEMFNGEFLTAVDTQQPINLLRQQYSAPTDASELNRMLYLDWQFTLADNDLRKVCTMCKLAGVAVDFPLISDPLVDFSCAIPSALKLKGGNLRYFFRYAMRGFLAPETLRKSKHGFGLPFGLWLKDYQPLKELAHGSLAKLKTRGYFNPEFIDKALTMHESTHAGYYGELVWIMMMLELWLAAHEA